MRATLKSNCVSDCHRLLISLSLCVSGDQYWSLCGQLDSCTVKAQNIFFMGWMYLHFQLDEAFHEFLHCLVANLNEGLGRRVSISSIALLVLSPTVPSALYKYNIRPKLKSLIISTKFVFQFIRH